MDVLQAEAIAALPAPAAAAPAAAAGDNDQVEEVTIRDLPLKREAEALSSEATEEGAAAGPSDGSEDRGAQARKRARKTDDEEAAGVDTAATAAPAPPAERHVSEEASRYWGVDRVKGRKAKPWRASIRIMEQKGKSRQIYIATFSKEEDAARAFDRVNIAKLGHGKATTNFPIAEYRKEWDALEEMGTEGALALVRDHAAADRLDVLNKASKFRGVTKVKGLKAKPWASSIGVTENGKSRQIYISRTAKEDDAARSYDRVSIAKSGHAKAKTNFPVADYREEWASLEAMGVDGAVKLVREHAAADRPPPASAFRGVTLIKTRKGRNPTAKPWKVEIQVCDQEDGPKQTIFIGTFAVEEAAARAVDRVTIAAKGHAEAETNFPVDDYRAEWGQLEALGVDGVVMVVSLV